MYKQLVKAVGSKGGRPIKAVASCFRFSVFNKSKVNQNKLIGYWGYVHLKHSDSTWEFKQGSPRGIYAITQN